MFTFGLYIYTYTYHQHMYKSTAPTHHPMYMHAPSGTRLGSSILCMDEKSGLVGLISHTFPAMNH